MKSALYHSRVTHVRTSPKRHRLTYKVSYMLIELAEWDQLGCMSRFLGVDRPGLMRLSRTDYLLGEDRPLVDQLAEVLSTQGISERLHRAQLMTTPRMLGIQFNPLSIFYCYGTDDRVMAIVYEVANTFGERHHYVVQMDGDMRRVHRADKCFYVSPFMETSGAYRFRLHTPTDTLHVAMESKDRNDNTLFASLKGQRANLSASALRGLLLRQPWMILKVIAGIHYEALKLFVKGLKVYSHQSAPERPSRVTSGHLGPVVKRIHP